MPKFITLSKFNGPNPATPVYVNVDHIAAFERTPGVGTPTTTIWGVEENGRPLQVVETTGHVLQLLAAP